MLNGLFNTTKPIHLYILLTLILFITRYLFLSTQYGVEHDSAWYLGLAKNLAQKGIYASSTNTVAYEGEGAFSSIHEKYSVQDKEGYVYFPAGVTVGPGYIIPQSFLLSLFGNGWWQYRLWPVISFIIFLATVFYITYRLGGFVGLLILQIWLWFLPQLNVNVSFEAFSEHLALLFILLSFLALEKAIFSKKKWYFFFAGLSVASAYLTKSLYLINLAVILIAAFIHLIIEITTANKLHRQKNGKIVNSLKLIVQKLQKIFLPYSLSWILVLTGFVIPIVAFELYKYISLTTQFGIEGWRAVNKEIEMTYQISGSGVDTLQKCMLDTKLLISKFNIWHDIGIYQSALGWSLFFLLPVIMLTQKSNRFLFFLLWLAALISFGWFVLLSPLGWGRHIYHSLMITIILFSSSIGILATKKGIIIKVIALVLATLLIVNIISLPKSTPNYFLSQQDVNKWFEFREERGIQGFPPVALVPRNDQEQIIEFFSQSIRPQDQVYYINAFVLADVSALTGKILFPISRYERSAETQLPDNGIAYLMLGPYQISKHKLVKDEYMQKALTKCQKIVFQNSNYLICQLKEKSELKTIDSNL